MSEPNPERHGQHPIVGECIRRLQPGQKENTILTRKDQYEALGAIIKVTDGFAASQISRQLLAVAYFLQSERESPTASDRVAALATAAAKHSQSLQKTTREAGAKALEGRADFRRFEGRPRVAKDDTDAAYRKDKPTVRSDFMIPRRRV